MLVSSLIEPLDLGTPLLVILPLVSSRGNFDTGEVGVTGVDEFELVLLTGDMFPFWATRPKSIVQKTKIMQHC